MFTLSLPPTKYGRRNDWEQDKVNGPSHGTALCIQYTRPIRIVLYSTHGAVDVRRFQWLMLPSRRLNPAFRLVEEDGEKAPMSWLSFETLQLMPNTRRCRVHADAEDMLLIPRLSTD